MTTKTLYTFTLISLINFLLAATLGLMLRYAFIGDIPFNFNYLLHAHSHVAALGWAYQMIGTLIVFFFIKKDSDFYKKLFWVTQISVFGMMFSFPFQGYGSVSIPFSSLHIICSYSFIFFVWKNAFYNSASEKYFLRAALIFLAISTLGIWMLGPSIALYGKNSILYQISIQFYLHFQFSGWFIFSILALLIRHFSATIYLELAPAILKRLTILLIATVPLSFSLVAYWFFKNESLILINALVVFIQLFLVIFLISRLRKVSLLFANHDKSIRLLLFIGLLSLMLKVIFQTFTSIPEIAILSHQVRNFSIGYIHLIMLGFASSILFFMIFGILKMKMNLSGKLAIWLFIVGYVLSEFILFLQGILFSNGLGQMNSYHEILFIISTLLIIAIAIIGVNLYKQKPEIKSE
jgi:hypothetical protein